ncbi:MAG: universal stress protein [Sediminibacterium sp.]|nr:universal stress protein [Sediminibacterium sp.]
MKNFLAVFDGLRLSKSTVSYAIQLSAHADAHLIGVFLDDISYRSYDVAQVIKKHGDYESVIQQLEEKDRKKRDASVAYFEKKCQEAGIRFSVHRSKKIALKELKEESMFADLIIIGKQETFTKFKEDIPTRFIKELLADVQCGVLVVPQIFRPIDHIVLLYDGGPSSLYAMKMYSYLFGKVEAIPVTMLTILPASEGEHLPHNRLVKEFISRHYKSITFSIKHGEPEQEILKFLRKHTENELVVLGAYRRTEFSRWFKSSMADVLMQETDTPLFIAHN